MRGEEEEEMGGCQWVGMGRPSNQGSYKKGLLRQEEEQEEEESSLSSFLCLSACMGGWVRETHGESVVWVGVPFPFFVPRRRRGLRQSRPGKRR